MPLANALLDPARVTEPELRIPLDLVRCLACELVQLGEVVAPDIMFTNYPYHTSASAPLIAHFNGLAAALPVRFVPPGSFVIEIGSNDGTLLRALRDRGLRPLGVEPAANLARIADQAGLETLNTFFSVDMARKIREERGSASAVVATNVFAHIDDLHGVVSGLDELLDEDGVFVAEVQYLSDIIEGVQYDTIYHEHLSYFSLGPLIDLFARVGMELIDVERPRIHGGSLRFFAARRGRRMIGPAVERLRSGERELLGEPSVYDTFRSNVRRSREALRDLLFELGARGKSVAALGATAKGAILLNYCGVGADLVRSIGDSTPYKQGKLSPGTHIPIVPESEMAASRPDYILLLAWNFADAIISRYADYITAGGRFIVPIPFAKVIGS